jgi:hypothetical protein
VIVRQQARYFARELILIIARLAERRSAPGSTRLDPAVRLPDKSRAAGDASAGSHCSKNSLVFRTEAFA